MRQQIRPILGHYKLKNHTLREVEVRPVFGVDGSRSAAYVRLTIRDDSGFFKMADLTPDMARDIAAGLVISAEQITSPSATVLTEAYESSDHSLEQQGEGVSG